LNEESMRKRKCGFYIQLYQFQYVVKLGEIKGEEK
jgi:hypothetical protein